jgi:hypothetical protein
MSRMKTSLLACVLACCASHALAGPLAIDTTAMPGWHGTTSYSNIHGLVGTIDYAVWAPGTFPGIFAGFSASDYVYAYQAHETGFADLSQVSVTLTGPTDNSNIGNFSGNNGFGLVAGDPSISAFINPLDTANWLFDAVVQGSSTDGLAYSSPFGPTWSQARNVDDGTIAFAVPVPSPITNAPEPGTLTLAACGFAVMAFQWMRRRGTRMSV